MIRNPPAASIRCAIYTRKSTEEGLELDFNSLDAVPAVAEMNQNGWTTKLWHTKKGQARGGRPFDKCTLFKLLTNSVYIGKVTHKDRMYEGEHEAIVPVDIFDRVQKMLRRNGRNGGALVRNKYGALLKGILRCKTCGCSMGHSYSSKNGTIRYRYYVCLNAQKRGWHTCATKSVPAEEIERFIVERIKGVGRDPQVLAATLEEARGQGSEAIEQLSAEKAALEREMKQLGTDIRKLVTEDSRSGTVSDRLADLNERLRASENRAIELREQIAAVGDDLVGEREIAAALQAFDPVWDELSARERSRILRLLIERVDYDGAAGTVAITFHPAGIRALATDRIAEAAA